MQKQYYFPCKLGKLIFEIIIKKVNFQIKFFAIIQPYYCLWHYLLLKRGSNINFAQEIRNTFFWHFFTFSFTVNLGSYSKRQIINHVQIIWWLDECNFHLNTKQYQLHTMTKTLGMSSLSYICLSSKQLVDVLEN